MNNHDRIKAQISASTILESDKQELNDIFAQISDDSLVDIADLFEKSPKWVQVFNDNRKAKQRAMTSRDQSLWQEILEQEKKYMSELTYGLD